MLKKLENKVIAILEPSGYGGICHYTYNLYRALSRHGVTVRVISTTENELDGLAQLDGYLPIFSGECPHWKKWFKIFKQLHILQPSILHIQSLFTVRRDVFMLALLRVLPIRVVYTVHNVMPHDKIEREAVGMWKAFQAVYRLSDLLITHSDGDRQQLMTEFGIDGKKVLVIPHGNYDFFPKGQRAAEKLNIWSSVGAGPQTRVVLFFGALRPYKGVHRLIEAVALLKEKNLRVLIVGHKMERSENYPDIIRNLIQRNELQQVVHFEEKYVPFEEVYKYFDAADAVALPYTHIYDSGVLRLSYAFSKPVVATKVGIFKKLVVEGENGFLAENTTESLKDALYRLCCTSKDNLLRMGARGYESSKDELDWNLVAEKTIDGYTKFKTF